MAKTVILSISYEDLAGMLEQSKRVAEGCRVVEVEESSQYGEITVKLTWADKEPTDV